MTTWPSHLQQRNTCRRQLGRRRQCAKIVKNLKKICRELETDVQGRLSHSEDCDYDVAEVLVRSGIFERANRASLRGGSA